MKATNRNQEVTLADEIAIGVHASGGTCVKKTTCGRFAIVQSKPRKNGTLRLIRVVSDRLHARRYNFSIHGDSLGE